MPFELFSPVGRQVQGSILDIRTTDAKGNPLKTMDGKDKQTVFFAMAFPKTQAAWWFEPDPLWMAIYNEGRQGYPMHFNPDGSCKLPRFAWKVMDGDGVDDDGKPNNQKPGMAGHWILKFSSTYPPKVMHGGSYITDPKALKNGWFYRVLVGGQANIGSPKPGVFLNPLGVELIAMGEEIQGGADIAGAIAAAGQAVLPAGAIALPPGFAGQGGTAPNMRPPGAGNMAPPPMGQAPGGAMHPPPGMGATPSGMAPPPMAAPGGMAPPPLAGPGTMAPPGALQPNHAFVQNAGAVPPALTPPPVVQPTYGPGPAAQGFMPDAWLGQGHTVETLLAGGQIVRLS